MRNFFKEYVDIVSSIEILILLIMGGYWSYDKYNENTLKQEVRVLDKLPKNMVIYSWTWYISHNYDTIENSSNNDTRYILETSIGETTNINIGSEKELLAIKCKVAKETIIENNKYKLFKLEKEKAEKLRDSISELALERLNSPTCK